MFANADSLFYYAREARHGQRSLSQEEIHRLLSQARDPDTTNVTSVSVRHDAFEEDIIREREDLEGLGEGEEAEGDEGQGMRGTGDGQSLHVSSPTLEKEQLNDGSDVLADSCDPLTSTHAVDQWSPHQAGYDESVFRSQVDQSGAQGGVGDGQTESQASIESWMNTQEVSETGTLS